MIRRYITPLRLALMTADAVSAVAVFVAVSVLRFGSEDWRETWNVVGVDARALAVGYGVAWTVILWLFGLYRLRARWTARTEIGDVVRAVVVLALVTFVALFWLKLPNVSRTFLLLLFPTQMVVTLASRSFLRWSFATARARGLNSRYMLIVGTGQPAREFADRVERHREMGLHVIGHLAVSPGGPLLVGRRPVLGTIDDIEDVIHGRVVDEIAICLPASELALVEPTARLGEEEGKIVRIPVGETRLSLQGARVEDFDGQPVLSLVYGPDRAVALIIKRAGDVLVSTLALVILSPLLLAVAAWVRLRDGSPILFRQNRVGLHGRQFRIVKFRTMVPDAEALRTELLERNEIQGQAFKVTDDPRVSHTGRILRATSIDELPQLWNVLLGQMSLVGPRPPLPDEVDKYDLWHRRRLSMKPGITGLWQVAARRESEFDRWVRMDLEYIDRWSLWLDLKIIARTIPAVVSQEGR
jgi:exopolysaccharide biosynthesis polyprenyl glycosylphosphotransferase